MNKIKKILLVLLIAFLSAFLFSCYYKKNGAKNYQHIFKYDSDLGYGEHKYNSYLLLFPRETPKTLVEFHYETVIALDVDCYGIYFICKLSKENYDAFIYGLDNFVVKYGEEERKLLVNTDNSSLEEYSKLSDEEKIIYTNYFKVFTMQKQGLLKLDEDVEKLFLSRMDEMNKLKSISETK